MITITIPPELESSLVEAAKQRGATPELLAVEGLRRLYAPVSAAESAHGNTLADYLQGYIGTIEGNSEPWSEQTGTRFVDTLLAERQRHQP